jgi:hypothetical protein
MSAPSPEAADGGLVNFNGLSIKKSSVPTLVESLVKSDPLNPPTGEDLEEIRRQEIALLMQGRLDRESALRMLSSLEADSLGLNYLAGLMATRC